jgi:hypothetical protein
MEALDEVEKGGGGGVPPIGGVPIIGEAPIEGGGGVCMEGPVEGVFGGGGGVAAAGLLSFYSF